MKRILAILVLVACAYAAWKKNGAPATVDAVRPGSVEELTALAATVQPDEVIMYSTTECAYCAQAKSWLNQYGFAFKECNMTTTPQCEREFLSYGATGTPYMIVRGRPMKDGFDSDEFIALLKKI